ncbi:hypothetical protein [Amycolatopsis anabasis]|uniref:hypothetical protein n=1 Tax=Amycolatopsis anabasis TaxID=1840409 RepID=UPI00131E5496|nr:hypothetical protein [Amycolatopsis anabasis]
MVGHEHETKGTWRSKLTATGADVNPDVQAEQADPTEVKPQPRDSFALAAEAPDEAAGTAGETARTAAEDEAPTGQVKPQPRHSPYKGRVIAK